jgi:integrase
MSVYFDRSKQRWRWSYNRIVQGVRRRSTKLLPAGWDRARAEAYDREHSGRLYAQSTGVETPALSLAGAVALYLDHRIPQLRDGRNIAAELARMVDDIERTPIEEVGNLAREYAARHADRLKPATIRNRLSYLRAAVRYAYRRHGYGDRDHSDRMTMPTVNNERQIYLRHGEVVQLLKAVEDEASRAVFTLAYYCGLRWISEVLPRQPGDVKRLDGVPWLLVGQTKNGTPRMKPVHPAARWALKHLPFTGHWRDHYREFEIARKARKLQHVRAHDLRHSLASDIISRGGTLSDVQAALHHDSLISAKRYAHLYPERVRDVLLGVGRGRAHRAPRGTQKKAA